LQKLFDAGFNCILPKIPNERPFDTAKITLLVGKLSVYIQGSCCINLRFYAKVTLTKKTGERMNSFKTALFVVLVALVVVIPYGNASAGQVWTKCHITCRCLQDNSVGNFLFNIPLDTTPDVGFDADLACNQYAYRTCADGCNGTKFSYTYQVTSP
jgi:hypothetical protein